MRCYFVDGRRYFQFVDHVQLQVSQISVSVAVRPLGMIFWINSQPMHNSLMLRASSDISTPCPQKTKQICFCHNCIKFPPILIIFGRKMANDPNMCKVHSFSTSP